MAGDAQDATNVRVTFRTYREFVAKLKQIARARELRIGTRLSVGKALNYVIEAYDDTVERKKIAAKKKARK